MKVALASRQWEWPRLVEREDPRASSDEVVVRIQAAGVCHTDLHVLEDVRAGRIGDIVLGHEMAGQIHEVGPGVVGLTEGDPVVVHFEVPCGTCRYCMSGRENLCPHGRAMGLSCDGGYAQLVQVPAHRVIRLPGDHDLGEVATLPCSGATAFHAVVVRGAVRPTERVLIYGTGGVGLAAVQIAKAAGAEVLAVDVSEEKLAVAKRVGASATINAAEGVVARVSELTGGEGVDLLIDFVVSEETGGSYVDLLARGGRAIVFGVGKRPFLLDPHQLLTRELTLEGSLSATMSDLASVVKLSREGKLKPVVSRREPLERAADVLQDLQEGRILGRAVLEP